MIIKRVKNKAHRVARVMFFVYFFLAYAQSMSVAITETTVHTLRPYNFVEVSEHNLESSQI
jgi:hypothetical protein